MDGDRLLWEISVPSARKYNCAVMLDEAHAVGIFGREGRGLADEEGVGMKLMFL